MVEMRTDFLNQAKYSLEHFIKTYSSDTGKHLGRFVFLEALLCSTYQKSEQGIHPEVYLSFKILADDSLQKIKKFNQINENLLFRIEAFMHYIDIIDNLTLFAYGKKDLDFLNNLEKEYFLALNQLRNSSDDYEFFQNGDKFAKSRLETSNIINLTLNISPFLKGNAQPLLVELYHISVQNDISLGSIAEIYNSTGPFNASNLIKNHIHFPKKIDEDYIQSYRDDKSIDNSSSAQKLQLFEISLNPYDSLNLNKDASLGDLLLAYESMKLVIANSNLEDVDKIIKHEQLKKHYNTILNQFVNKN
jgi:hypothetical protein